MFEVCEVLSIFSHLLVGVAAKSAAGDAFQFRHRLHALGKGRYRPFPAPQRWSTVDLLFVTSVLDMKNPNCVYVFKGTVVMRFSTNFLFGQKTLPGPHICKHAKTVSLNLSRTSNFAIEYLWVNEIFFK